MAANHLQNPIFQDDDKAREWLEARVRANGRVCPHCGAPEDPTCKLEGKVHRAGLCQCNQCREQFTATVGTIMERSFSLLKRGIFGAYHHVNAAHLKRYIGKFDFRYNSRKMSDIERLMIAAERIKGKRLTYRRVGESAND